MISRLGLGDDSLVVEAGSNDGYLLKHFVARSIPVLGIDPAHNVIEVARANGVPTLGEFLNQDLAADLVDKGKQADLLVGNNVFAHVPDINSFTRGLSLLLKPDGVLTLEFPHLLRLLEETQFDTIYHEHYAYYSLLAAENILSTHGLKLFDVEELSTHGGSLRLFACRSDSNRFDESAAVEALRMTELQAGLDRPDVYARFSDRLPQVRQEFNEFVAEIRRNSKRIAGYSAPAKGNTFLNYCGLTAEDIPFVTDLNLDKQNHLLPGSRIPIRPPQELYEFKPDYVLILAWNLKKEISRQLRDIAKWGGRFVTGIPRVEVFDADSQEPVMV
jgi:SAM-dependent methyltransferase